MKFETTLEIAASARDARNRARAFLRRAGYRSDPKSLLRFRRGSIRGSLTSFSPRKWKARAAVSIEPLDGDHTRVSLAVTVNTTGQRVTERETTFWQAEMDAFREALETGVFPMDRLDDDLEVITTGGWKGLRVFVVVALAVGIPVGLIGAFIHTSFAQAGVLAGISAGMAAARKHWGL